MSKFCTECGTEVSDSEQKFCIGCGAQLQTSDASAKQEKAQSAGADQKKKADELDGEFPELAKLKGEQSAWMPLLSFLAIPGWSFFAWGFWGLNDWLSLVFAFGAVFFFFFFFYSSWKFHHYNSIEAQTRVLIRAFRDPANSTNQEGGGAR